MSNPGIIAFFSALIFRLIVQAAFSTENPVIDFVMGQRGRQACLTWQSEIDCSYLIERSSDLGLGSKWSQIASQPGTGSKMTWVDPEVLGLENFYRIGRLSTLTQVAAYGDSITAQSAYNYGTGVPAITIAETSYMMWAQAFLNGRFEHLARQDNHTSPLDFGHSGANIADLASGALFGGVYPMAELLGRNPKLVVELSGANNVIYVYGQTPAGIASARVANWDYMLAHGVKRIVAIAILPASTSGLGEIQTALADAANELLQDAAASRAVTWVPYPTVLKSAGTVDYHYYRDGLHLNHLGAQALGRAVADALDPLVSATPFDIPAEGSARWLTNNPYMAGSIPINHGSGVRATGGWEDWFGINGTLVASKVTDAEGTWQRFVMGGQTENSHGATGAMFWHLRSLKTVATGTKVRFVAHIRTIDPIRAIGMSNVQAEINNRSGMFVSTGFGSSNNYPLDLAPFDQLFIGPITEVQSSSTVNIWFTPAGNGTVDITQCGVISVP